MKWTRRPLCHQSQQAKNKGRHSSRGGFVYDKHEKHNNVEQSLSAGFRTDEEDAVDQRRVGQPPTSQDCIQCENGLVHQEGNRSCAGDRTLKTPGHLKGKELQQRQVPLETRGKPQPEGTDFAAIGEAGSPGEANVVLPENRLSKSCDTTLRYESPEPMRCCAVLYHIIGSPHHRVHQGVHQRLDPASMARHLGHVLGLRPGWSPVFHGQQRRIDTSEYLVQHLAEVHRRTTRYLHGKIWREV
mmetsp:Transcript_41280/g.88675  ORF Transcript_41280/g.88675 Transcript_41280/m.88675 type:complete len:243 (+) Transcript_41280:365-1093(+)